MAIRGADGSIILTTKIDETGLKQGMTSMKGITKMLTGEFKKLGGIIATAFSIRAIIKFSNEASKMSSTTEASVRRLIDIYGEASHALGTFIDTNARALGMSKAAATQYSAVYGNLFSVWADQEQNAMLTTQYLNATAVVASKTGRTMTDVQERIRSGLLGNTEAVEDLGIFVNVKTIEMTEAFQSVAKGAKWDSLTAAQQSQVRALAILEQATKKYGNEVAQTTALTRARYSAAYEDFKNTWGTVVNYILMPVLKVATQIFNVLTKGLQLIAGLSGKTIESNTQFKEQENAIGGAVKNQEALTDAVKGTAKEQKKLLAGFDDLQIISAQNADTAGGGSGAGNSGGIEPLQLDTQIPTDGKQEVATEWIDEITEKLPVATWSFGLLKRAIDELSPSFTILKEGFMKMWNGGLGDAVMLILDIAIAAGLDVITIAINILSGAMTALGGVFTVVNGIVQLFAGLLTGDFSLAMEGATEILKGFGLIIEGVLIALLGKDATDAVKKWAKETYDNTIKPWWESNVKPVFEGLQTVLNGLINFIVGVFTGDWDRAWEGLSTIVKGITDVFVSLFGDEFGEENIRTVMNGLVTFLEGVFKGDWKQAWEGLKDVAIGIINGLMTAVENGVNFIIRQLNKLSFDVPDWVPGIGGKKFGFNLKTIDIPELARGAVLPPNKPFLAMVGDQKHGTNIEAPAELIKQMAMEAMLEVGAVGQTTREEHYYLNETELMSIIYKLVKGGERLRGNSLISGGAY